MDSNKRRWITELTHYSTVGLSLAFAIFIGLGIGVYLDRKFDTTPWCTLIFMGLGIAAGFRNVAMAIKKIRKF